MNDNDNNNNNSILLRTFQKRKKNKIKMGGIFLNGHFHWLHTN